MHAQCAFVCTHKPNWKRFRHHRQNNGFEWQNFMFVDLVLARDYCWQYTHCHHCYHHYYYSTSFAVSVHFGYCLPLPTRSGNFFNCSICYLCVTRRVFRIRDQTVSLSPNCAKVRNVISFIHQQLCKKRNGINKDSGNGFRSKQQKKQQLDKKVSFYSAEYSLWVALFILSLSNRPRKLFFCSISTPIFVANESSRWIHFFGRFISAYVDTEWYPPQKKKKKNSFRKVQIHRYTLCRARCVRAVCCVHRYDGSSTSKLYTLHRLGGSYTANRVCVCGGSGWCV